MTEKRKNQKKKSEPHDLARFIEEFSWFLKSFEDIDLNALSGFARSTQSQSLARGRKASAIDETTSNLVGFLPRFFTDSKLFPANEDIVEFAQAALGIPLTRWHKKSKYEIIGQIVCHTNEASPNKISRLSELIDEMRDEKKNIRMEIESNRSSGQSWSEVISRLYENE